MSDFDLDLYELFAGGVIAVLLGLLVAALVTLFF